MPTIRSTKLPPAIQQFDTYLSKQLPTMVRINIRADNGNHSFIATKDMLETIAQLCLKAAAKLPKPRDLS